MRGLPYYEEPSYHKYLLSRERREISLEESLLEQLQWVGLQNLLDFGMGNGFYTPLFYRFMPKGCNLWGAECQENLIDYVLQAKVREGWENFIPFFIERTEHPLLPDWIPEMDLVFCSCVLSTFADPALAIKGVGRVLAPKGKIVILDWERVEAPNGPEIGQKVSRDRMEFLVDDAGYQIEKSLKANKWFYAMVVSPNPTAKSNQGSLHYLDY